MLYVREAVWSALLTEAKNEFPRESCGLLGGQMDCVDEMYVVKNVAEDPTRYFQMAPYDVKKAHQVMREAGKEWVGVFHSHPVAPAIPSELDLQDAALLLEGIYYLIVSVADTDIQVYQVQNDGLCKIEARFL